MAGLVKSIKAFGGLRRASKFCIDKKEQEEGRGERRKVGVNGKAETKVGKTRAREGKRPKEEGP